MSDATPIPIVYLGTITLEGNKLGELWTTEALALAATTAEELRRAGSAFGKRRTSYTVGAVYDSANSELVGGKLTKLGRDMTYRRMVETDAVAARALHERGLKARDDNKRAEAKARKAGPCDELLDQVARIVAKAPFEQHGTICMGFSAEVQRRALDIWRKSR